MNILFYCDEYPPMKTGGIGSITKIVAEKLVSMGHKVFVVGYYESSTKKIIKEIINGVYIYRINLGYRKGRIKTFLCKVLFHFGILGGVIQKEVSFLEKFIQGVIKSENIDVLELTDFYKFNFLSSKKIKFIKFDIPTVLRIHGSVSFVNSQNGINKKCCKDNDSEHFNRCDYILAVSKFSLDYVNDNFKLNKIANDNRKVIYNSIEDSFLQKSDHNVENKRILFLGKLIETKGCYSILKAFNKVSEQYPDWKLVMVGRGDVEKAKEYIHPNFLERVEFLGYLNREEIKSQIDLCSFACIPTYFENFSMAALEVMARNKALIFTNRTSGDEIITNGVDGLLVDPEDIEQITSCMLKLIENKGYRVDLADKGYNKIKREFLVSNIILLMEEFYKKISLK